MNSTHDLENLKCSPTGTVICQWICGRYFLVHSCNKMTHFGKGSQPNILWVINVPVHPSPLWFDPQPCYLWNAFMFVCYVYARWYTTDAVQRFVRQIWAILENGLRGFRACCEIFPPLRTNVTVSASVCRGLSRHSSLLLLPPSSRHPSTTSEGWAVREVKRQRYNCYMYFYFG